MKKALLILLKMYKATRPFRPPSCRFYPSCSSYAYVALEKHGILRGLTLTVWRLLRCHPLCDGGIDDVPEHFHFHVRLPFSGFKRFLQVKR